VPPSATLSLKRRISQFNNAAAAQRTNAGPDEQTFIADLNTELLAYL
jgi:hypothetical protein